MVGTLDSGLSGLGSSPGRGHCVAILGKTLKWVPASVMLGGVTLRWKNVPFRRGQEYSQSINTTAGNRERLRRYGPLGPTQTFRLPKNRSQFFIPVPRSPFFKTFLILFSPKVTRCKLTLQDRIWKCDVKFSLVFDKVYTEESRFMDTRLIPTPDYYTDSNLSQVFGQLRSSTNKRRERKQSINPPPSPLPFAVCRTALRLTERSEQAILTFLQGRNS